MSQDCYLFLRCLDANPRSVRIGNATFVNFFTLLKLIKRNEEWHQVID